jgi:hypothetical protein
MKLVYYIIGQRFERALEEVRNLEIYTREGFEIYNNNNLIYKHIGTANK